MSGSLLEVLTDNEYRANRSCVLAGLWTAAVCALICLIGLTGAFGISRWWMCWYAGAIILPILAIAAYAKARNCRGAEIKHLVVHCYPSFAICLSFFAIAMSRLCRDGQEALDHQAKVYARLADVEKGLAIAATMEVMQGLSAPRREDASGTVSGSTVTVPAASRREALRQPEVGDWSTTQIIKCISRCKARAAEDPEFAALVERNPAAAVREVQA